MVAGVNGVLIAPSTSARDGALKRSSRRVARRLIPRPGFDFYSYLSRVAMASKPSLLFYLQLYFSASYPTRIQDPDQEACCHTRTSGKRSTTQSIPGLSLSAFISEPMLFLFTTLPAGLNLYYFMFNLLSIIEQYFVQKKGKKTGDENEVIVKQTQVLKNKGKK